MEALLERPDGCKLFYQVDDFTDPWRKAETVLFVHGLAESGEAWRGWVPYFSRHSCRESMSQISILARPRIRGSSSSSMTSHKWQPSRE